MLMLGQMRGLLWLSQVAHKGNYTPERTVSNTTVQKTTFQPTNVTERQSQEIESQERNWRGGGGRVDV